MFSRRLIAGSRRNALSGTKLSSIRHASSSATANSSRYSGYETTGKRQPSKYGWRYHLDNTFQFILWASFGSAAIHLLNIKQTYAEKDRRLSTKIAVLKDIIRRVGEGEQVDIARELKVGKTEEEREWEEVMNSFRQEAGIDVSSDVGRDENDTSTKQLTDSRLPSTSQPLSPASNHTGDKPSIVKDSPHSSGWFWKT